jgi:hypothetical protein
MLNEPPSGFWTGPMVGFVKSAEREEDKSHFHAMQDDTYTESYISTIGVDFVSPYNISFLASRFRKPYNQIKRL